MARWLLGGLNRTPIAPQVRRVLAQQASKPEPRAMLRDSLGKFNEDGVFIFPRLPANPLPGRHALVVLPFYGKDAASLVTDDICAALRAEGYVVHVLHYSDYPHRPASPHWDHAYFLDVQSGRFGRPRARETGDAATPDGIDDWAGDELALFTTLLSQSFDFELCACHYVFLSRCLDYLPAGTLRLLFTHDVYAGRNARVAQAGGDAANWYFSTSAAEEAKALRRADRVIAIQAEDAAYFSSVLGPGRVVLMPYVPPDRPLAPAENGQRFVIGYIGSSHPPNVNAIRGFAMEFDFSCGAVLRVAGGVCGPLSHYRLSRRVELLGEVQDLAAFYESCDLMINPDMLKSGLKIKSLEALSFGRPLICTAPASTGIGMQAEFHTAPSIAHAARCAARAACDSDFREAVAAESQRVFAAFRQLYGSGNFIHGFARLAEARHRELQD